VATFSSCVRPRLALLIAGTDGWLARALSRERNDCPGSMVRSQRTISRYPTYVFAPMLLLWIGGYPCQAPRRATLIGSTCACWHPALHSAELMPDEDHFFLGLFPVIEIVPSFHVIVSNVVANCAVSASCSLLPSWSWCPLALFIPRGTCFSSIGHADLNRLWW